MNAQQRGRLGENQAARLLVERGYSIVDRNYRSGRWGEIDLVCIEGGDLVFIEVKTRSSSQFGDPIEAVSWGKRQRLLRAAHQYKLTHPQTPESMRVDVVAVKITAAGYVTHIQLFQNIEVN